MTHTKTPWEINEDAGGDASIVSGEILTRNGVNEYPESVAFLSRYSSGKHKANAQRIVKCVNMHDELVETLERCSWILANMDDDNNYCSSNDYLNAVHFTQQLIDKARGE